MSKWHAVIPKGTADGGGRVYIYSTRDNEGNRFESAGAISEETHKKVMRVILDDCTKCNWEPPEAKS